MMTNRHNRKADRMTLYTIEETEFEKEGKTASADGAVSALLMKRIQQKKMAASHPALHAGSEMVEPSFPVLCAVSGRQTILPP